MLKHHSSSCRGPSISRGPDRHFSFVALAGKDGVQIKISQSKGSIFAYKTRRCVISNGPRGGNEREMCTSISAAAADALAKNTFRKLAFLK